MLSTIPKYNAETEEQIITATPAVKLDNKLKEEILSQIQEVGTVIVHCSYTSLYDDRIRI